MGRLAGWLIGEGGIREHSREGKGGKQRKRTGHFNCFGGSR